MFKPSTDKVINKAPPQAKSTQFWYGLMANWKITTGKLAMGAFISKEKNGLFNAVNNKGAVSPLTRAKAKSTPVMTPLLAAFKTMDSETFHFGAPSANAASRKLTGTKLNMFSVVRTTTGMAISVRAKVPAQPEKCFAFTTTNA